MNGSSARVMGYNCHRLGYLLAMCPHKPGDLRREWRAGWLEREESFTRVARLDVRRREGVL